MSDNPNASGREVTKAVEGSPAVRFASVNEEIPPESFSNLNAIPPPSAIQGDDQQKLKELSQTLHGSHLQERRMSHFAFEPVSLPASRVSPLSYFGPLFFACPPEEKDWKRSDRSYSPTLNYTLGQVRLCLGSPRLTGIIDLGALKMGSQVHPHALERNLPECPTFLHFSIYCLSCPSSSCSVKQTADPL